MGSGGLDKKRRIQNTLFPEGVFYCVRKHEYLTKKMNTFASVTHCLAMGYPQNENWTSQYFIEKSNLAPPAGLEPATL